MVSLQVKRLQGRTPAELKVTLPHLLSKFAKECYTSPSTPTFLVESEAEGHNKLRGVSGEQTLALRTRVTNKVAFTQEDLPTTREGIQTYSKNRLIKVILKWKGLLPLPERN